MIVGVSGYTQDRSGNVGSAAAGKSLVASRLVERYQFVEIAFADEIKRLCRRYWGFSEEQLWGSEKDAVVAGRVPRDYFQHVGSSMRALDPDIWARFALLDAINVLHGATYSKRKGVYQYSGLAAGVVIPDVRFPNEVQAIRDAGGVVWRKKRNVEKLSVGPHISEIGLAGWPDSAFDAVLDDASTVGTLNAAVDAAFELVEKR